MQLAPNEYSISIRGLQGRRRRIITRLSAGHAARRGRQGNGWNSNAGANLGLPALWIPEERRQEAERCQLYGGGFAGGAGHPSNGGYKGAYPRTPGPAGSENPHLDSLRESHPAVVDELVPTILGLGQVQRILANLLRERVSIRDLVTILETLADYGPLTKDTDILTEYVRQALARQISQQYRPESGPLPGPYPWILGWKSCSGNALQKTDYGNYLALGPPGGRKTVPGGRGRISRRLVTGVISQSFSAVL